MSFKKAVLKNGVKVVTESYQESRAVAAGIFVGSGSRDERHKSEGISHFLEHIVFKGTKRRSAYELAKEMEAVGGDLNAYTTREYTCFHATSLKEHLSLNLDVLCDIVCDAEFSNRDFTKEKQVVLQEIAMTVDQPEEFVFDLFLEKVYGKHPLSHNILGSEKTVGGLTRTQVLNYYRSQYAGPNLIVSVCGGMDHDEVVELVDARLGKLKRKFQKLRRSKPRFKPFVEIVPKETEQVHVVLGLPAASFSDELRFEAFIVNALLGGGMTSHLYQNIREKRGLAYSVYSTLMTFTDAGLILTYAGTDAKNVRQTIELILKELHALRKQILSQRALDLFKTQVRGSILLGSDDIENRMNSLGINEMVFGEYRAVDRVIHDIDSISRASVKRYLDQYYDPDNISIAVVGGVSDVDRNWIESLI
ncbi:MAG: insulinase family protein [Bdellovibrionales bacterium]|nr:insulinase family protein [Bdellovibrionales bacterium]